MTTDKLDEPAQLKVIGLGLGRSGTLSLCSALETLGFGPCYHPFRLNVDITQADFWGKFAEVAKDADNASPEVLADLFRGYVSAVDSMTAVLAKPLYKAYPNAKFILTVRDAAKWAESLKNTTMKFHARYTGLEQKISSGTATEADHISLAKVKKIGYSDWTHFYHDQYHGGQLTTDPEGAFLRHNQYITQLIPPEKLLVFDVADGWKPLAEFLGVPEPSEPFPHLNGPDNYDQIGRRWREKVVGQTQTESSG